MNGFSSSGFVGSIAGSCAGNPSLRLASPGITAWGSGGPSAILVYPEYLTETTGSGCFTILDGSGGVSGHGMLLASSGVQPAGESLPVLMIDAARAAVVSRQDMRLMLHVVGIPGGETGRAEMEALAAGEECSAASLVSLDGDFVAAAWRKKLEGGIVLSMLGRWSVGALGELIPVGVAPVAPGGESSAIMRGVGLASPGPGSQRLVIVTTVGPAVETVWLDKGSPQGDFESVTFDAGLEPDAAIEGSELLEEGAVYVLVSRPSPEPEKCSFTLLGIPGPGAAGAPREVQSWGEAAPFGCHAKLLRLTGQRLAVVMRTLVENEAGDFAGDLSVDIVATSE